MALIKFYDGYGKDLIINTDYIVSVVEEESYSCTIRLVKGEMIKVSQSVRYIWDLIEEAKNTN